jgi:hypothetical protein
MKTYGEENVWIHAFLTSVRVEGEWLASRLARFPFGEKAPGTHWIGGRADHRTGIDDMEKSNILPLQGLELLSLGRPTHSRLRYPGSQFVCMVTKNYVILALSFFFVKLRCLYFLCVHGLRYVIDTWKIVQDKTNIFCLWFQIFGTLRGIGHVLL